MNNLTLKYLYVTNNVQERRENLKTIARASSIVRSIGRVYENTYLNCAQMQRCERPSMTVNTRSPKSFAPLRCKLRWVSARYVISVGNDYFVAAG